MGVGLVVDKRLRPVTMIELVRSIEGSEGLAGTLTAVAPGSTYTELTRTVVMMPVLPSEVENETPLPRSVMIGRVRSGTVVAMAAAVAAADVVVDPMAEDDEVLEELLISPDSKAAAAPQFPLTLHLRVLLQVTWPLSEQGSKTDRVREAMTTFPAESIAE